MTGTFFQPLRGLFPALGWGRAVAAVLLLMLAGSGCATKEPPQTALPPTEAVTPAPVQAPEPPQLEELPTLLSDEAIPEAGGQLYSVAVRDADLKDVLMALSKDSGVNIVVPEAVKGKVTVNLVQVTLSEALEAILRSTGFTFVREKSVLRITDSLTKIFKVDYVSLANAPLQSSQGAIGGGSGGASRGGSGGGGSRGGSSSGGQGDFWKNIEDELEKLKSDRGEVTIDEIGGLLVVRDTPDAVEKISEFLHELSESLHRQVEIQAQILEVLLDKNSQLGIDWSAPLNMGILAPYTRGSAGQTLAPSGGTFNFFLTNDHIKVLLSALSSQGQTNLLSAPKVVAMQNQGATITITEQVPYFTTDIVAVGQQAVVSTNVQFSNAGIVLTVVPHISENGAIMMKVEPSISSVVGFTEARPNLDPVPILDQRTTSTFVRAIDGQTVVIGGLMRNRALETRSQVPFVAKIPFLGALFRNTKQELKKTELIILITPRIVTLPDALVKIAEVDKANLEALKQPFSFGELQQGERKQK